MIVLFFKYSCTFGWAFIHAHDSNEDSCKDIVESKECKIIFLTAVFWLAVPVIFWVLSHITTLNLFVDRYFITKEIAAIILVAYFSNLLSTSFKISVISFPPNDNSVYLCHLYYFKL